ncbi:MAG: type II toxin-antitoxin system HicB family antitoxin [Crocosphaera sp.]|nr:type II toxin-antitoxin system HicB family antitoxin [Crocosphaera sp.]
MAMQTIQQFTAIIEREGEGYVSLCPELDIASQGETIEEARDNLKEAVELFLEVADPSEINTRLKNDIFITKLEVSIG